MEKEEIFAQPPGPLGGLWSVYYIDAWKFLIRQFQGFRHVRKEAFKNTLKLGTPMPPAKLRATDDTEFNLSDFHGKKNIVIEFGAIT